MSFTKSNAIDLKQRNAIMSSFSRLIVKLEHILIHSRMHENITGNFSAVRIISTLQFKHGQVRVES